MIHPTAIIHPDTKIGNNVFIGPYTVIADKVSIGDGTHISAHVCIGYEAEHSTNKYELNKRDYNGEIRIGSGVVIREFTMVNRPLKTATVIEDHVYVMGHCYIAHDCQIEEYAILSNSVVLGGWTRVCKGANLGLSTTVHQYSTIGDYAMIAANATIVKDVPPLVKYIPNKELLINVYAIRKWEIPLVGENPSDIIKQDFYVRLFEGWEARRFKERTAYQFAKLYE